MPTAAPPKNNTALGRNIKLAREAKNMPQLTLAHEIGLKGKNAGAYICRVEAGQEPRMEKLQKIAAVLETTLDALLAPAE